MKKAKKMVYGMTATYDLTYGFIFPDEHWHGA